MRRLTFAFCLAALGCALAFACSDTTINKTCTGIPKGGCPGDDSTNCVDTTCEAIYSNDSACVWSFVQKCPGYIPPHDGPPDALTEAGDAVAEAPLPDAGFTLPSGAAGGPGCEDLENPDCSVATAVACGKYCCGCEDLYVCVEGGWNLWGGCTDAGLVEPLSQ